MKLEIRRTDILIQLPEYTGQLTRETNGLSLHTLTSQTYNPVSGKVYQSNGKHVKVGDTVYFQIFTYSVAVERAYGNPDPDHNNYKPYGYFAFQEGDCWYMIIREEDLYLATRGNHIIMLNGYALATPVKLTSTSTFEIANLTGKMYSPNTAMIVASDGAYKYGQYVKTLRHCDITLEEKLNSPLLPEEYFIIETKNIIAIMDNPPKAGKGRVIVRPDVIETEQGGLINPSLANQKLLKGIVVAAGEATNWEESEHVLYARNSGMPYEDLLILEDKDIFAAIKP